MVGDPRSNSGIQTQSRSPPSVHGHCRQHCSLPEDAIDQSAARSELSDAKLAETTKARGGRKSPELLGLVGSGRKVHFQI
jgi:hypothetical protein